MPLGVDNVAIFILVIYCGAILTRMFIIQAYFEEIASPIIMSHFETRPLILSTPFRVHYTIR